jgi:hypothetical protein
MNDLLESAKAIVYTLLSHHKGEITDETILSMIEKASAINIIEGLEFDKRELFEIFKAELSIGKGEITVLSEDIEPWLSDEKVNLKFSLWNRYKAYIKNNDSSFPINELDDFTDKILDKCVNPRKDGSWDRRGMVVGHVQSGKTSNYVGLINKATDAGYKVIIVIAGTISSLRRQTQERIDSGYIGRNSSAFIREKENRVIGVGQSKFNDLKNPVNDPYGFTSSFYTKNDEGDFNQSIANRLNIPIGKNPIVFVIKKNKSILENLIDWFSKDANTQIVDGTPKLFNVPALIIDDEADAASVNASKSIEDIKTINKLIRTLLNLFNQNTFIGYTATPYANLFISQEYDKEAITEVKKKQYKIGEDLFPRDFIINIKAPTNYIGAAKIFGYENANPELTKEPLDIFRGIDDYDPPFFRTINRDNKDDLPEYLPKSLEQAIKSFILTCAIRRVRGHQNKHNSMLVHVALLVRWIDRVAYLVNEKTKEYKNAIQSEDQKLLKELKELYETDFLPTTLNVLDNLDYTDIRIKENTWEEIKNELKNAVLKIDVRSVHGTRSTTNLEYHNIEEIDYNRHENGLSVIAVGGSRLSRGITLEGLSISYYIRTTRMYDSLMQMGRWFGYRPGYVDLCRLYTTNQIFEWFNHITMATEEMRNDFDEMTATHQRPKDFRLKVRNHHGLLTITSLNKLHFSEDIEISFSGENIQTYQLLKTKLAIENNFFALKNLIESIGFPSKENRIERNGNIRHLLYRNVNIEALCAFIDSYKINQPNIKNSILSEYIRNQANGNNIKEWSICIVSNTDNKVFVDYQGNTLPNEREPNRVLAKYNLVYKGEAISMGCSVRNQIFRDRGSEYYKISKNQIDQTGDRQVDLDIQSKEYAKIKENRAKEQKGLLLIYALDERGTFFEDKFELPIIGYSLHFPKIQNEIKVSYTTTQNRELNSDVMIDDDNPETENE